ncbi:MAG TPA: SDR family NAD(P)-dependent oxidoreductase [Candidatus Obscuribacterales bacterium]
MNNSMKGRNILITGGAGFIGSHLVDRLLAAGDRLVVLDNFNDYYDPQKKRRNIAAHLAHPAYRLVEGDLRDEAKLRDVFSTAPFDVVVHLAAMAGVRPSLAQPAYYMDVNVNGTQKLIDKIIDHSPKARLIFGSSSSVYGNRSGEMFLETDRVDQPLSPYAASKAAGELISYSAHHTRGLNVVCLRFFTVFGPRQRPDLAIHKFCKLILKGEPVEVYGDGSTRRDYTFVSDIVDGITSAMTYDLPGYDIINLGRSEPVILMDMIRALEESLERKANIVHKPLQIGDMPYTYAGIEKARQLLGYEPRVSFEEGVRRFVEWYLAARADSPLEVKT